MAAPKSILLVAPEFGVDADGTYRPGGLQQFSRCVFRALASCNALDRVDGWGLVEDAGGAAFLERGYLNGQSRARDVSVRGFASDRRRMAIAYLARSGAYDLAIFLHIGVGRLSIMNPFARSSLWLVGTEVRRPLRWFEKLAVRRADPLLSISTFSTEEMLRLNPTLPSARTVHLCVEPSAPWTQKDAAVESFSYEPSSRDPAVLIVARMAANERHKGHDQLIEAWPSVVARCPLAELWIAGSGDGVPRLRARAEALPQPARDRVRFLGRLSHDELARAYERARVFAMPSLGEGFGLVFVEAMRKGLPCICSPDASQEVVEDGATGLVVDQAPGPIADACVRLLSDDALAKRMSVAGMKRFAENFTFDTFRARLLGELGLPDRA